MRTRATAAQRVPPAISRNDCRIEPRAHLGDSTEETTRVLQLMSRLKTMAD